MWQPFLFGLLQGIICARHLNLCEALLASHSCTFTIRFSFARVKIMQYADFTAAPNTK